MLRKPFLNMIVGSLARAYDSWRCALYGHVLDCEFLITSFPFASQN